MTSGFGNILSSLRNLFVTSRPGADAENAKKEEISTKSESYQTPNKFGSGRKVFNNFSCRKVTPRPPPSPEQFITTPISNKTLSMKELYTPSKTTTVLDSPMSMFEKSPAKTENKGFQMLKPDDISKEGQVEKSAAIFILNKFAQKGDQNIQYNPNQIYYKFCGELDLFNRRKIKKLKKEQEEHVETYSQNQLDEAKHALSGIQEESERWLQYNDKSLPIQDFPPIPNLTDEPIDITGEPSKNIIIKLDLIQKNVNSMESKMEECKENAAELAIILNQISSIKADPISVVSDSYSKK